ncbi:MAG: UDP-N-acetylglucosamine 2-epimerase (non-hydrolyzing) [Candidimonas sp.]|nr:UDP-N-acetylglucosamine 2-epimerase (non-hydrolyzing) [Candidimonas sp.]
MHILSVVGTRPEAIKMAPLVLALRRHPHIRHTLCTSGQHTHMLTPILELFGLVPDVSLDVMHQGQTLNTLAARVMQGMDRVLADASPDYVLVHGDTTTAMAAAMAAFQARYPVAHVEAGLRTGNLGQPYPEEMNRRVIDALSALMFAPTQAARDNLVAENLTGKYWVTGNTIIDALAHACDILDQSASLAQPIERRFAFLDPARQTVLVTGHRRENFGIGLANICAALAELARDPAVQIVYPVHLNAQVREPVLRYLGGIDNIHLIEPADYLTFIWLMRRADLILTDSGGVQEEAPYLQKPVLVMRDITERPEAIANGTARLIGTDAGRIVCEARALLDDPQLYRPTPSRRSPYGDGKASSRIIAALTGVAVDEFSVLEHATV